MEHIEPTNHYGNQWCGASEANDERSSEEPRYCDERLHAPLYQGEAHQDYDKAQDNGAQRFKEAHSAMMRRRSIVRTISSS
ncbi:hypothetical protein Konnatiik_00006 [Pseudomonas phage vB_PpuP-Konnatiik]